MNEIKADSAKEEIERMRSLVPGLDDILCGGFPRDGLYMIQGSPGTGKTILASQIIYSQAAEAPTSKSAPNGSEAALVVCIHFPLRTMC